MALIKKLAQEEPAATFTVISWIASIITGVSGHPEFTPVLIAVGLAFLGVRSQVTPTSKVENVTETAATEVLKQASSTAAGKVGEITDAGLALVKDVVGSLFKKGDKNV